MKKLVFIITLVFALGLSGCHFPGFEEDAALDPDDAMATEIARILTGTPIQVEPSPTSIPEEIEETEEVEEVQPTEPEETLPEPTQPVEVEQPTSTPAPTNTPIPSPTPTLADSDPVLTLGDPDWVDNMNNSDNWLTGYDQYTAISFENGFLKLTATSDVDGWRVSWPILDDFYLETTLQTPDCEGNDHFGLMFRVPADSQAGKGYLFGITCDGRYSLRRWNGSTMHFLVNWTTHESIQKGKDVVNRLGIMARGANLALYINGLKVNEVTDSNYLDGKFGIFVGGTNVDDLTVWVDQVRYWNEP